MEIQGDFGSDYTAENSERNHFMVELESLYARRDSLYGRTDIDEDSNMQFPLRP